MKKYIEIDRKKLSELLADADHGTTNRDICYNTETGEIADLHTTQQRGDWVVLVDLYHTGYDDVDTYTVEDWLDLIDDQDFLGETIAGETIAGDWEPVILIPELV